MTSHITGHFGIRIMSVKMTYGSGFYFRVLDLKMKYTTTY